MKIYYMQKMDALYKVCLQAFNTNMQSQARLCTIYKMYLQILTLGL